MRPHITRNKEKIERAIVLPSAAEMETNPVDDELWLMKLNFNWVNWVNFHPIRDDLIPFDSSLNVLSKFYLVRLDSIERNPAKSR